MYKLITGHGGCKVPILGQSSIFNIFYGNIPSSHMDLFFVIFFITISFFSLQFHVNVNLRVIAKIYFRNMYITDAFATILLFTLHKTVSLL